MKKFVIALEGSDGSGKSTAVQVVEALCRDMGVAFSLIGRAKNGASPSIQALTNVFCQHGSELSLESDLVLRVAREFVRAQKAAEAKVGVVILDRFVLSVLARYETERIELDWVEDSLACAVMLAELNATVYVECPFETAWERTQIALRKRVRQPSFKETRGVEYNRRFSMNQRHLFENKSLTMTKIRLDNSSSPSEFRGRVEEVFIPIANQIREHNSN